MLEVSLYCVLTHGWLSSNHLKVIGLVFIIQVDFLLKDGEWISYEEVCYVLGQQFVNSYTQQADFSFLYCTSIY